MDDDAAPPKSVRALSRREIIGLLILVALAVVAALPELRQTYAGAVLSGACQGCRPPEVPPGLSPTGGAHRPDRARSACVARAGALS